MQNKVDEQEEEIYQKNKQHRALREKLKQKRKKEKVLKKQKKLKKLKYENDKDQIREQYFKQKYKKKDSNGIKIEKLNKVLKKFIKIYADDISDFLDLFKNLDEGHEVETAEIENKKVKKYLEKIFKYLKIKENKKHNFKKNDKCPVPNVHAYINKLITILMEKMMESDYDSDEISDEDVVKKIKNNKENNSDNKMLDKNNDIEDEKVDVDDSDDDNDDSESSDSENEKVKDQVKKKVKLNNDISQVNQKGELNNKKSELIEKQDNQICNQPIKIKQDKLDKTISQQANQQFKQHLEDSIKVDSKRDNWMMGDWKGFMDEKFSNVEQKQLKRFLDNRQKPTDELQNQKQFKSRNEQEMFCQGSAKINGEPVDEDQQQMRDYISNYNTQFRPKSLMEEHQEKMALQKQQQKGKPLERRPFDRDKDLTVTRVDSKRIFQMMKEGEVYSKKFSSGKFESSFL